MLLLCIFFVPVAWAQQVNDDAFKIRQYDEELSMRLVNTLGEYDGLLLAGSQDAVDLVATSVRRPLGSWHYTQLTGTALNPYKGPDPLYLCPLPGAGRIVVADGSGWGVIDVNAGVAARRGSFEQGVRCRGLFPVGDDRFLLITQKNVQLRALASNKPLDIFDDNLQTVCAARHGDTLIVVDTSGVFAFSISQKTKWRVSAEPPPAAFLNSNSRQSAAFWSENLVLSAGKKLWIVLPDGRFSPPVELKNECDILAVAAYAYGGALCLFVATDIGLYAWRPGDDSPASFPLPLDRLRKKPTQFTALHVTADGTLLVGTRSAGVLAFRDDRPALLVPHVPFAQAVDYEQNYPRSLTFLGNNSVIALGADPGNIVLYDLQSRRTLGVRAIGHRPLHDIRANALAYDGASQTLYAGLNSGAVLRFGYDTQERQLRREDTLAFERPAGNLTVTSLLVDHGGGLWVGGIGGLYRAADRDAPLIEVRGSAGLKIRFIALRGEELWCATEEGIYRVSTRPGSVVRRLEGFDTVSVSHLNFVDATRVLISTRAQGAWLASVDGNRLVVLRHFDAACGLSVYREPAIYLVYASLVDANGQVWMSTNRGLFRIGLDDPDGLFAWYNYKDLGLPWPAEFNTGSVAQYDGRTLLFGCRDGLAELRVTPGRRHVPPAGRRLVIWKENAGNDPRFNNIKGLTPAGVSERLLEGFSVARYYFIPTGFADDGSPAVRVWAAGGDTAAISGGAPYELRENAVRRGWFEFQKKHRLYDERGQAVFTVKINYVKTLATALVITGLLSVAVFLFVFYRQKINIRDRILKESRLKSEINAREIRQAWLLALLHETGGRLTKATRIADIQAIFDGAGFDGLLRDALHSDQIAVVLHQESAGVLQIDALYAGEPHPQQAEKPVFWLEESLDLVPDSQKAERRAQIDIDRNRPVVAVWEWANGKRENNLPDDPDELVNNHAEFYERYGRRRQSPKVGLLSDSFIFQVIRVDDRPVGLVAIQQRRPGAYTQLENGRYQEAEYLKVLRDYLALSISRIWKTQEQRLSELQTGLLRHALQHRFSSHFIGNTLGEACRLANFESGTTDYLDRLAVFYKRLFLQINADTELRHELDLVKAYFEGIHNRFHHNIGKPKITLVQHPVYLSGELAALRVPSFILLNTINNSVEHNKLSDNLTEITVQINLELLNVADARVLRITVRDDAPGNHAKQSQPGRTGFTKLLRAYFEELNEAHHIGAQSESAFALRTERLEGGQGFQTTIQINCPHQ